MNENSNLDQKYFPILRGRLNELHAIRELAESGELNKRILPIVEPLALSSALLSTIETFGKKKIPLGIIRNPSIGTLKADLALENETVLINTYETLLNQSNNFIDFYYLKGNIPLEVDSLGTDRKFGLIVDSLDSQPIYETISKKKFPWLTLIPDGTAFRRKFKHNRVLLEDRFNKLPRNTDYLLVEDEPFSEDHVYFEEEGYSGFSDYSVIGKEYVENGFAPYAIALHIVYMQEPLSRESPLRIRHFVSDSNIDINDPARKFEEAASKLSQILA